MNEICEAGEPGQDAHLKYPGGRLPRLWPVVCLLAIALAINLTDFYRIETTHQNAAVWKVNPIAPDMQTIVVRSGNEAVTSRYLLPSSIQVVTGGGARIEAHGNAPVAIDSLHGLGLVRSYVIGEHDPHLTAAQAKDLESWIRFEGEDLVTGHFAVATADGPADTLLIYQRNGTTLFVDQRLVSLLGLQP